MTVHPINISFPEAFKYCLSKYRLEAGVNNRFQSYFIELRNISLDAVKENLDTSRGLIKKNSQYCDILITSNFNDPDELAGVFFEEGAKSEKEKFLSVIKNFVEYDKNVLNIGVRNFNMSDAHIMGILNVTPDSFSDGGKYQNIDLALSHAEEMILNGVDIIDIGGESTRPGSDSVSVEEEIKRTVPVIKLILEKYPDTVISIDTTKAETARAALENGAKIVNDISGSTFEPEILDVVKEYNAAYVLMHIKGVPKSMQKDIHYEDVISEVYDFLDEKTEKAKSKGIKNIIIDPGIGFGKTVENNLEIIKRLEEFKGVAPILMGVSRKSFIGKTINAEVSERDFPTAVAESVSVMNGARFIRTHNVSNAVKMKKLLNFINNPHAAKEL